MDSAPGFRFHPTDEELVFFYLKRKVSTKSFRFDPVGVVDIYKFEPWDLPSMSKLKTKDLEWYFFTVLDKKYGNGSRTNRATDRGYWKTTGKDRPVKHRNREVGMKKTLVYHLGRAPHGNRTNWVMHEYRLLDEELAEFGAVQDPYVLCRIFEKSGSGPKNGEKYGAPLGDKEWENDNVVDPLPVAVDDDDGPLKVVPASAVNATAAASSAVDDDDHLETADLEKELDTSVTIGSAGFPSNFYHGECSSHPVHSQAFLNDPKPLEGTFGISWPQPYSMADQYGVDTNSVKDEDNGELSHNENPLNFNCAFDGLDISLDAAGDPVIFGDGSYLETNDLLSSVIDDPSGAEMLDEYLKYLDDDVLKYISFDSPQNTGSEIPIDNHGQPSIEQNVEGETSDSSLANKHVFEAQSGNEASSKQNSEAPNLVSDDTNPFVKRAHKLLAGIPAAPAFASEFPTKEFALGLHPAAQPSNSAHVTAGMISITDITFRGNAMDWMVGKNGGFNTIMSTGFSQPDVNSAALVPISGLVCSKTAFVLSHGWIYLMGFSVLILSLTFKIGSFMYTGK